MKNSKPNDPAPVTPATPAAKKSTPWWSKVFTVAVFLGAAVFSIALLPRGYSQDTSEVGQGEKVVVLFQQEFSVESQKNMDTLNALRSEYNDRVKFIVTDKKMAQGKKFAETHEVESTAFLFFAPSGKKIHTIYGEQSAQALRDSVNKAFNF